MTPLPARTLLDHGLTRAALGDEDAAIEALRQAVAAKPGLTAGWAALADLLARRGDAQGAQAALAQAGAPGAARAKPGPAGKLEAGERAWRDRLRGQARAGAEAELRARLLENPTDAPALRLLAESLAAAGAVTRAEALLLRALDLAPGYTGARHAWALLLFRSAQEARALPVIERLVADEPRNLAFRILLASTLSLLGGYERAVPLFEAVLKEVPGDADVRIAYAQALKTMGRRAEAVAALRATLALAPGAGEAWWTLANLKNEVLSAADMDTMRAQLARGALAPEARIPIHYALGHALEQAGAYQASFAQYSEGAARKKAASAYNAAETSRRVRRAMDVFTPEMLASGTGWRDDAPIFILGMPRAGSTLIEQILASHSQVEGTMELPEMLHIARELADGRDAYPECVAALGNDARASLGARFIERTRIYRKTARPVFIDKMPSNWAYTGLILAILPRARIIDARRAPMASCWSAFKQYLPGVAGFPCGLADLGRYYRDYVAMMAHFDDIMPGRVHRVHYERMVEETEAETRRLLAYCQLPFEPACLRFWETRRAVSTASAEQVRQPIFRGGLDQWRHYEPWLGPLAEALGMCVAPDARVA